MNLPAFERWRLRERQGEWLASRTMGKLFCCEWLHDRASLSVVGFRSHCSRLVHDIAFLIIRNTTRCGQSFSKLLRAPMMTTASLIISTKPFCVQLSALSRSQWCALRLFEFSLDKIVMIYRTRRLKARKAKSFVSLLWFSLSGAFRRQPRAEENRRWLSVRRLTTTVKKKKTRWNLAESWFKQALDWSESGASGWER